LIEEINRKYEGRDRDDDLPGASRGRRFFIGTVALLLAVIFLFTVTGRWLSVFADPAITFLRESRALSDDPLVSELRESVVRVYVDNIPGAPQTRVRGSGFNVKPEGLIVTNRHIVEGAASVRVSFPGRGTYTAQQWIVSPHADLALIIIESVDLPVVKISDRRAVPGEEILVIGNPLQFARIANRGILAGYRENYGRENPFLIVEALIYPGSSGSPVFNEQGEVIGVVFATLRNSDPAKVRGLAVDAAEVKLLIEEYLVQF
jgi:serine protease Do